MPANGGEPPTNWAIALLLPDQECFELVGIESDVVSCEVIRKRRRLRIARMA
jgi:hypothetical protein